MQDNVRLVYEFSQRASKIYHREWLQIQISLYGEFTSVSDWFTICFNLCIALLSGNNFGLGKGVLDKLYRQPCLFRKYFAVSSVSHYCWWSFISWSKWKEFWYRAVEDTENYEHLVQLIRQEVTRNEERRR